MKVRLIACYGVLAHEKEPVYRYSPDVHADHWEAQEDVWVELPDEYISGRTAFGELLVNFGNTDYLLRDVIGNKGDDPVLIVPSLRWSKIIPLRVLTAQELPRVTPGESAIAQLRREHGMTQADLAKRVGCTQSQIAAWETGVREPKLGSLRKIAEALEVDLGELIGS